MAKMMVKMTARGFILLDKAIDSRSADGGESFASQSPL